MSFLSLYKAFLLFGTFTTFTLSCSPVNENYISINLQAKQNWRVNVDYGFLYPGTKITTYNSGSNTPSFNEIYLLNKSSPGIYEIRPFWDFDLATAVEMPVGSVSVGDAFKVNTINGKDNQKFSIECAICDISTSSTDWIPYHTTCSIKNIASGLCMNGVPGTPAFNVTQFDCKSAPAWDIYG
ncbi:4785_t:CDS:2, partial [Entrophospora sp. SA101]